MSCLAYVPANGCASSQTQSVPSSWRDGTRVDLPAGMPNPWRSNACVSRAIEPFQVCCSSEIGAFQICFSFIRSAAKPGRSACPTFIAKDESELDQDAPFTDEIIANPKQLDIVAQLPVNPNEYGVSFFPSENTIRIREIISPIKKTDPTPQVFPTAREIADPQRQLDIIAQLPDNWNGYGASAFSPEIIGRIRKIISSFTATDPAPQVFPTAADSIQLEFEEGKNYLEFEIYEDSRIQAYMEKGEETREGIITEADIATWLKDFSS